MDVYLRHNLWRSGKLPCTTPDKNTFRINTESRQAAIDSHLQPDAFDRQRTASTAKTSLIATN